MAAHAHAHVWRPGVAPDYACARFGCHAVGRWRAGKVRAVAEKAEADDGILAGLRDDVRDLRRAVERLEGRIEHAAESDRAEALLDGEE